MVGLNNIYWIVQSQWTLLRPLPRDLWLMVSSRQLLTSFRCQFNIFCPLDYMVGYILFQNHAPTYHMPCAIYNTLSLCRFKEMTKMALDMRIDTEDRNRDTIIGHNDNVDNIHIVREQ